MEPAQAAQDVRRRVLVAAGAGRAVLGFGDPDVGEAVEDALEADARFGARERRARTGVDAVTERDVLPRVRAVDVELVGVLEAAGIAVGGAVEHHHRRAGRDVDAAERASGRVTTGSRP